MTATVCLLSGVPRSGTSLACRLLNEVADSISLSEPLQLAEFDDIARPEDAIAYITSRVAEITDGILESGRAPSTHLAGQLNDARVSADTDASGLRAPQGEQGEIAIDKPLSDGFRLYVKHNALFAALLPDIAKSAEFVALVRNPVSVLASWQTVDLPVHQGHIPAGEKYDAALGEKLAGEADRIQRQLHILDWFFGRYLGYLKPGQIVRYEEMIESNGSALFAAAGCPAQAAALSSRNEYRDVDLEQLLGQLRDYPGAWLDLYPESALEATAAALADPS